MRDEDKLRCLIEKKEFMSLGMDCEFCGKHYKKYVQKNVCDECFPKRYGGKKNRIRELKRFTYYLLFLGVPYSIICQKLDLKIQIYCWLFMMLGAFSHVLVILAMDIF